MLQNLHMIDLFVLSVFSLVSFGTSLIFYDQWQRERAKRRARVDSIEHARLRQCATHWCNEVIRLERLLKREHSERRRWEMAHAERLPQDFS